ncbi:tripartite tricarboxylate transporter substrate binding protein [Bradyrhizobium sp. NBAIM20]|nr:MULTISPECIES: tripartite tricarboxylate transporter substrate-binding protein [unclassified Bradyrhizobium]MCA1414364.1 tripartite tricarboxylate transporter substrate binding protein [Bradyrhizobium sp. NBAIM20]MCA1465620.1 tripartite tricarboxylate transporter substrate binding protein [Bradyrhizobium sp. NBAIM18]
MKIAGTLIFGLACSIVALVSPSAFAQEWPAKAVTIIVPFGAGSTPDMVARLIGDELQKKHPGSAFVVESKAGAGGVIGTDAVAKATPDGTTIGVSIGAPLAIDTLLMSKLPYDPAKDIVPITQLVTTASVIAVNSSLNVNSMAELIALLKKEPDKYNFGSIGNGSLSHLAMEAIGLKSGAKMVQVPYPSSPAAVIGLVSGDVQLAALPAVAVMPQATSGKVKVLAVSLPKRSSFLPNVPTLKESGIDVEADAWMGLIAPRGTPKALANTINKEVTEAITSKAVREKLATQYMEPVGNSPEQFRAVINAEIARWEPIIKAAKIQKVD